MNVFPPYDEKYIYGILSNYYPRVRQDASLNKFIALFEKPDGTVVQNIDMVTQDVFRIDERLYCCQCRYGRWQNVSSNRFLEDCLNIQVGDTQPSIII